ncbi:hypothetical protein MTBPR1_10554 [Candidatus Terasakiella magnetica]|uniref:Uncharacterized protein n=1 Tax=Candidatus Terasakiella magnetica TaxID=1867952 RepID=A0A1C3RDE5_9PROT|nr:hypothetical protein MTBPR1_10554 [Candidatus Terasakiella magnetica]
MGLTALSGFFYVWGGNFIKIRNIRIFRSEVERYVLSYL